MTTDPRAVATTYFQSWQDRDFDTLRSLLADDVTFRGPLGTADGAEECLQGLQGMAQMITDIKIQKIFVDGSDVLTWYDLHTTVADPAPTANWSRLADGKITAIRATFDARPFTPPSD
jgi:limonene-1,2-epoxide hydrolase